MQNHIFKNKLTQVYSKAKNIPQFLIKKKKKKKNNYKKKNLFYQNWHKNKRKEKIYIKILM